MKTLTHKLPTIALLIAVFAVSVILAPSTAEAKWVDRSDELPGMAGDFNLTPYLIAAGVLVGGVVIYKIATSGSGSSDRDSVPWSENDATADNSDSVDEATTEDESAEVESTRGDHSSGSSSRSILVPEEGSRIGLFFNVTDDRPLLNADKQTLDFSDLTLRAGFTIGF
jgi:hypothetical protein